MTERLCPTCGTSKASDAFYRNCSECKECKRERSRRTRLLQARKLAAFERFVSVLFDLSARTADSDVRRGRSIPDGSQRQAKARVVSAAPQQLATSQEA